MYSRDHVRELIRGFLAQNFYLDGELGDDASLLDEGVIDSTGVLELIVFLEETFGFAVPDEDMVPEYLDSVERLTLYVTNKVARPTPAQPPPADK